jgi:hypothetical protein
MIDLCRPYLDFSEGYIDQVVWLDHCPHEIKGKDFMEKAKKEGFHDVYQGWGCGMVYDSYKRGQTWTWKYRHPGDYAKDQKIRVGSSNEKIHSSVRERWTSKSDWRPKSLEGFEPEERNGKWVWVKKERFGKERIIEEEPFAGKWVLVKTEGSRNETIEEPPANHQPSFEWKLRHEPIPPAGFKPPGL